MSIPDEIEFKDIDNRSNITYESDTNQLADEFQDSQDWVNWKFI